jgi:hypothetical protein
MAPRPRGTDAPGSYFLFVGEDGSALGGMQDYYGSYRRVEAARRAVPADVQWAEVAAVRDGRLEVVASGRRTGIHGRWQWRWENATQSEEQGSRRHAAA